MQNIKIPIVNLNPKSGKAIPVKHTNFLDEEEAEAVDMNSLLPEPHPVEVLTEYFTRLS